MRRKRNCASPRECLLCSRSSSTATPLLLHPSWIFSEPKSWTCGEKPLPSPLLDECGDQLNMLITLITSINSYQKSSVKHAFWNQYLFLNIGVKVLELHINTIQMCNSDCILITAQHVSHSFWPLIRSGDICWQRLLRTEFSVSWTPMMHCVVSWQRDEHQRSAPRSRVLRNNSSR